MADKGQGEKYFETEEDLTQVEIPQTLPLLPLRGIVIFPNQTHPFLVSRPSSLKLLEEVGQSQLIALTAQKNPEEESPAPEALYQRGTAVRILKMLKYPDKSVRVLVQGIARIELQQFIQREPYFVARVGRLAETLVANREVDALQANLVSQFSKFVSLVPYLPDELQMMAMQVHDPGRLSDLVAAYLKIAIEELQDLLSTLEVRQRLEKLIVILSREIELLELGHKIQSQVQTELNKTQREYFLRQQLKAIQKELGETDGRSAEIDDLEKKIESAQMPEEARKAADKELDRLRMIPPESAEHTVVRTYLDWLVSLPWCISTEDNLDIAHARAVLDEDHYDLEKVKERILEFLAVRKLKHDTKGPILCFVGPPGTGKTSLGRSIARALGRKFVRLSLGGIRDEAEIRGHRRTYIGSLPGRIVVAINSAVEVDLTGQVNAEIASGVYVGGTGGQGDFVRGAMMAARGHSIIALPATARDGVISRIVPLLQEVPVTTPRSDADIVVTEFGAAELRGQPLDERIRRMIAISHPNFREALQREARAL